MHRSLLFLAGIILSNPLLADPSAGQTPNTHQPADTAAETTYQRMAAKTVELSRSRDGRGLAAHLGMLKTAADLSVLDRERLLHDAARTATRMPPDATLRAEIEGLSTYQSRGRITWNEHGHPEQRIAYDVGAMARQVQRFWKEDDARAAATKTLANSGPGLIADYLSRQS